MRPTAIPAEEVFPGTHQDAILPPGYDLDSPISSVDVLRGNLGIGDAVMLRIELEDEDLERIARGERVFWLVWHSSVLVPFSLSWPDQFETVEIPAGALRFVGCDCGQGDDSEVHVTDCGVRRERWSGSEWVPDA